ncbi:hypothetical protein C4D60_Mb04t27020 [Musa balbisiana]|uniref:Uncharacterized protein n=1 Tax=Musa balbisiana TaxID=52838 RepID=A0A4S8KEZ7_MUSBA|nr:hypothetical protein C4D60_Mb04t27020 [Musa balbisiana]
MKTKRQGKIPIFELSDDEDLNGLFINCENGSNESENESVLDLLWNVICIVGIGEHNDGGCDEQQLRCKYGSAGDNESRKRSRDSLDDLHRHLDVALVRHLLHRVKLRHQGVPVGASPKEPPPPKRKKKKKTLGSEAPLQGGEGEREGGNKEEEGSQSLEKRELRGDAEGRDGEVELVEEAEGLVNGVDDLGQVLLRLLGRVGGGADGRGGGRVGGGAGGGGGPGGGEAAVTGGGGRILRGGIHRVESRRDREGNYRESPALL